MKSFKSLLERKSIELRWVDQGDAKAGAICVVSEGKEDKEASYLVKLNKNHPPAVQFTTLAHELGALVPGPHRPERSPQHPETSSEDSLGSRNRGRVRRLPRMRKKQHQIEV